MTLLSSRGNVPPALRLLAGEAFGLLGVLGVLGILGVERLVFLGVSSSEDGQLQLGERNILTNLRS